jgi:hypothetical protein
MATGLRLRLAVSGFEYNQHRFRVRLSAPRRNRGPFRLMRMPQGVYAWIEDLS